LLKKAKELAILCDAEVGVMSFSSTGKLYNIGHFFGRSSLITTMDNIMKRTREAYLGRKSRVGILAIGK
jgi:hypothetical protein